MTIGIFDSGLGGLVMARAFRRALPDHDFMYLGDALHVPYGPRSAEAIYEFTLRGVEYLFKQGCPLVIIACNTASASALRQLQQHYLPTHYPDRRILGVIVPTIETTIASGHQRIGLIGTAFTVKSRNYESELQKINPAIQLFAAQAPMLVPLVENNAIDFAEPFLRSYVEPLLEHNIDSLILGCTHYPLFRPMLEKILPAHIDIISQDAIIPEKLADYLQRHPEIDRQITRNGQLHPCLTDISPSYAEIGAQLFGETLNFTKVSI